MIIRTHREDTQVAAGLGNRGQIREELPLSTRVHELAKELGLKSQELLERIQKWGLDVKANALASLDPPMVDRIRELMDQPASGTEATSSASQHRPAPRAAHGVAARQRRGGSGIAAHWPGGSWIDLGKPCAHRSGPRCGADTVAAGRVLAADRGSAANDPRLVSLRIGPTRGIERPCGPGCAGTVQWATSGPGAGGPTVSPRRLFRNSARRRPPFRPHAASRGGPAAGRRPHVFRTSPATRAQGGQPSSQPSSSPGSGSSGFQPLKRDDYMSSAGTRPMTPRVGPSSSPSSGPRRPGGEAGGDAARREINQRIEPALAQRGRAHHPAASRRRSQRAAPSGTHAQDPAPGKVDDQGRNAGTDEVGSAQHFPIARWPRGPRRGTSRRAAASVVRDLPLVSSAAAPRSVPVPSPRRPAAGPGSAAPAAPQITTEEDDDKKGKTGRLGSAADRAGRRARRSERAVRSPRHLAGPRRRPPRG